MSNKMSIQLFNMPTDIIRQMLHCLSPFELLQMKGISKKVWVQVILLINHIRLVDREWYWSKCPNTDLWLVTEFCPPYAFEWRNKHAGHEFISWTERDARELQKRANKKFKFICAEYLEKADSGSYEWRLRKSKVVDRNYPMVDFLA